MSIEINTPSAAKLRQSAAAIALDIAHAPLKSRHHEKLQKLNADFLTLETTMAETSDILTAAITQVQDLVMETQRWSSVVHNSDAFRTALDNSLTSISGKEATSPQTKETAKPDTVVSSETAHP